MEAAISSKKKTTQDTTSHTVQTPTNPAWVDSGLQGLGGQISGLSQADPYSFVAGPDALQTQAAGAASGLTSSPNFQQASGIMNGVASAGPNLGGGPASLLDNWQSYMDPEINNVVNTSLADYDYGAGQTVAQNKLSLAGDTTFGGSGGAIQTALSNDALTRGRGTLSAGLRSTAFNNAMANSNLDANRRQQSGQFDAGQMDAQLQRQLAAGQGLSDIGQAQGNDQRANIATQGTLGQMLQQLAQQRAAAPLNLLGAQTQMYGSLPLNLLNGQTQDGTQHSNSTTTSSDPLGSIGSLAMGLGALGFAPLTGGASLAGMGAMVSDRRLKRDVVKLGTRPDGLGVYAFRYLWSAVRHIGVMAQDVLKVKPEAVITMPNGFYAVDYGAL